MCKKIIFMTVLFFLFFSAVILAEEICIACEGISDAPESVILLTLDGLAEEATAFIYYENYTAYSEGLIDNPRIGISNSIVFVHVTDSLGNQELLRLYTDDEGYATFDFSEYADVEERLTYGFRFIYCPFCHPDDAGYPCGFDECMSFAGITTSYSAPEDVPLAEGVSAPSASSLNDDTFLPSSKTITYVPPPPEATGATTPAFCLPLILIFALLGGAMLYTGRNPFAGFAISTPRMGRHIRYTPSGRGYSLDTKRIAMSIQSAASEGKGIKEAMKEGKSFGQAVGAVSFQAEKGKGGKMVRDILLNMISGGTYGSVRRTVKRLKEGVATQQRMTAAQQGQVGGDLGISGLSAGEAGTKAKTQYRAEKKALAEDPKKAVGKLLAGAFKNLGIGLLSSTFMGYAMSGVVEMMLNRTDAKIIDQAYMKTAALEIAEEDRAKAQGGHNMAPPVPYLKIDLENKDVTISEDGKYATYKTADGEIEVDLKAAAYGIVEGKKTVTTADGKTVTYYFTNVTAEGAPKNPDAPVAVTHMEVKSTTDKGTVTNTYAVTAEGLKHTATSETIGTGADAITRNYAVQADGTQKLVQVIAGEGKGALTYSLITTEGPRGGYVQAWSDGVQVFTEHPAEVTTALNMKAPETVTAPKGAPLSMSMLGIDAPGNITGQLGDIAKVVVDGVYLKGLNDPVKMEWALGAERDKNGNVVDYQYSQQLVTGESIQYNIENGRYDAAVKIGTDGAITSLEATGKGPYKTFEGTGAVAGKKVDIMDKYSTVLEKQAAYATALGEVTAGQQNESMNRFLTETGLGKGSSGYCDTVKEQALEIKVIGDKGKEQQIDSKAANILVKTGVPEGATPAQIEQSINANANRGASGEIYNYGQNKVKTSDLKKPEVQAGIAAASSVGTSAAGMNKSEYMAAVRSQLDLRTDLTTEQRAEAEATASKLWGKNGTAIKNIAEGYDSAAQQAVHAYPQYTKIQDSALEQHYGDLWKDKDPMLKKEITQAAKTYGAGSADKLNEEIIHTTADNPAEASIADNEKQKTLMNWAAYGLATPPKEIPKREGYQFESKVWETLAPKEGESDSEYEKRIIKEGLGPKEGETQQEYENRIIAKAQGEAKDFNKKIQSQQKRAENRWDSYAAKYVDFTTKGTNAGDALVAQSLILAADKKADLPDDVWKSAYSATTGMNMNNWKSAAKQTAEYIKKKQSEEQKKMAKDLSEVKI